MADLRNVMSGIITKAQEWELLPDSFANPIRRVRLPKKWEVREKRILGEDEMARVLAHIAEPNLLICGTCLDTGRRISEVTALMIKHVDLDRGTIQIAQRSWHGDIDEPKTEKRRRASALWRSVPLRSATGGGSRSYPTRVRTRGSSRKRMTPSIRDGTPVTGVHSRTPRNWKASTSPASVRTPFAAQTSLGGRRSAAAASKPARSPATPAPGSPRSTQWCK